MCVCVCVWPLSEGPEFAYVIAGNDTEQHNGGDTGVSSCCLIFLLWIPFFFFFFFFFFCSFCSFDEDARAVRGPPGAHERTEECTPQKKKKKRKKRTFFLTSLNRDFCAVSRFSSSLFCFVVVVVVKRAFKLTITGLNGALLGFTGFQLNFLGCYLVSLGFTGFY